MLVLALTGTTVAKANFGSTVTNVRQCALIVFLQPCLNAFCYRVHDRRKNVAPLMVKNTAKILWCLQLADLLFIVLLVG